MNKCHRVIWSHSRQALVVTDERAAARGKSPANRRALASAVGAALLSLAAGTALAGPCPAPSGGVITVASGSSVGQCLLTGSTAASIRNSGHINGVAGGGSSGGVRAATAGTIGSITNSGTIVGGWNAVNVANGTTLSQGLLNNGVISNTGGGQGIAVFTSAVVQNGIVNHGTISGGSGGVALGAHSSVSGGLVNSGLINAGSYGVLLHSSALSGGITNSASGTISGGAAGVRVATSSHLSGGITNIGQITGGQVGISVIDSSSVDSIVNTTTVAGSTVRAGTIRGGNTGIAVSSGSTIGGITNSGTIAGTNAAGIAVRPGGTVTNGIANSGTIAESQGQGSAILVNRASVSGGIANSGMISAAGRGIEISSSATVAGGITNSGTISGNGHAIEITNGGTVNGQPSGSSYGPAIYNTGLIESGSSFPDSSGIRIASSTVNGDIVNVGGASSGQGTISGNVYGLNIRGQSTVNGALVNSGRISGGNTGVYVGTNSTVTGGITNSGTINGGTYAINVDSTSTLANIHIQGNGTAAFGGEVLARGTQVTVDPGASYTMANGNWFNVAGFANEGTLKLGAGSVGTISGSFTNTGTFSPTVASATSFSQLLVDGTAHLGGVADINVQGATTIANGTTITGVIHATTLTGTFASVTTSSNLFTFTPLYTGTNFDLVVAAAANSGGASVVSDVVANGNTPAVGAARVLDGLIAQGGSTPMSAVITALGRMSTSLQVSNAASQTLPLLSGNSGLATAAVVSSLERLVQARQTGAGEGPEGDKRLWVTPYESSANQSDQGGASGFGAHVGGLVLGADTSLSPQARVGLALAWANADLRSNSNVAPSSDQVNFYQLIGYGSYALAVQTRVSYQFDLGTNANNGSRQIAFMGGTATSSFNSATVHAGAGIDRSYALSATDSFTPSARADYTWIREAGYTEAGAGALDLNVNAQATEQFVVSGDARYTHTLESGMKLLADAGLGYDTLAKQASASSSFAGAPGLSFATYGLSEKPWLLRGGLGLEKTTKGGMEISVRCDLDHRAGLNTQTVSARLRWSF